MNSTYTFEELAAAAASSNSISEAVLRLGREPTRTRNRYVMELMRALRIDCGHFRNPNQLYTPQMLEEAAAASRSIAEVVRRLGAKETGGTQTYIGRQLRRHGVDISHFGSSSRRRWPKEVPHSEFVDAIVRARSIAAVAKALDVADGNAFRRHFRKVVEAHGLNLSHMLGQGHARGKQTGRRLKPDDLLVADPTARRRIRADRVRTAMTEIGVPYCCAMCGTGPVWQGSEITLEVDHISGDITDNRPQNLRFLCPNCHATTATYCRRKRPKPTALDG